jgi:putative spermidine/putrescine transport system permease protein
MSSMNRMSNMNRRPAQQPQGQSARRPGVSRVRPLAHLLIVCISALIIIPLLVMILWSFTGRWPWPELLPLTFSTRGWQDIIDPHSQALAVLASSLLLSAAVAICSVVVSLPAARALALRNFRGRALLHFAVFLPVIVPATAFAMGVHPLFVQFGLRDSLPGVLLVHVILCLPYTVRILTDVCEATGEKLEAQARTLGASPMRTFSSVTMPMVAPGLISSLCMAFIVSFSQYFVTMLIGGGRVTTFAMFLFPYVSSGDRTLAAAYSLVFVLASLLVFVLFDWIVRRFYNIDEVAFYG